jgi:hypothetical protein
MTPRRQEPRRDRDGHSPDLNLRPAPARVEGPLAAAQRRLGQPGRPPKPKSVLPSEGSELPARPVSMRPAEASVPSVCPARLLRVKAAASYLGLSVWRLRGLIQRGVLTPVRIPLGNGREERRHLLDIRDLDDLIRKAKQ